MLSKKDHIVFLAGQIIASEPTTDAIDALKRASEIINDIQQGWRNASAGGKRKTAKKKTTTARDDEFLDEAKKTFEAHEVEEADWGIEWNPDPVQVALGAIFNRKSTTPWGEKEAKQYKKLIKEKSLESNGNEFSDIILEFYGAKIPEDEDFRRHDLVTLLNNWSGEVDRGRAWLAKDARRKKSQADEDTLDEFEIELYHEALKVIRDDGSTPLKLLVKPPDGLDLDNPSTIPSFRTLNAADKRVIREMMIELELGF